MPMTMRLARRVSILGIGRLDLADASAYKAFLAALEDCWDWSWPEMPFIEY
jgi:hypothetical protein